MARRASEHSIRPRTAHSLYDTLGRTDQCRRSRRRMSRILLLPPPHDLNQPTLYLCNFTGSQLLTLCCGKHGQREQTWAWHSLAHWNGSWFFALPSLWTPWVALSPLSVASRSPLFFLKKNNEVRLSQKWGKVLLLMISFSFSVKEGGFSIELIIEPRRSILRT